MSLLACVRLCELVCLCAKQTCVFSASLSDILRNAFGHSQHLSGLEFAEIRHCVHEECCRSL